MPPPPPPPKIPTSLRRAARLVEWNALHPAIRLSCGKLRTWISVQSPLIILVCFINLDTPTSTSGVAMLEQAGISASPLISSNFAFVHGTLHYSRVLEGISVSRPLVSTLTPSRDVLEPSQRTQFTNLTELAKCRVDMSRTKSVTIPPSVRFIPKLTVFDIQHYFVLKMMGIQQYSVLKTRLIDGSRSDQSYAIDRNPRVGSELRYWRGKDKSDLSMALGPAVWSVSRSAAPIRAAVDGSSASIALGGTVWHRESPYNLGITLVAECNILSMSTLSVCFIPRPPNLGSSPEWIPPGLEYGPFYPNFEPVPLDATEQRTIQCSAALELHVSDFYTRIQPILFIPSLESVRLRPEALRAQFLTASLLK
ncbi:hypothetical protein DFH09DRAFT_1393309 [Mycena vulgaris]|nr:hypothetical protein DFH09DRAFT_1393309 [Mycena vulgaris]